MYDNSNRIQKVYIIIIIIYRKGVSIEIYSKETKIIMEAITCAGI